MPLVMINCKPDWSIPNEDEPALNRKTIATLAMAQALPELIAEEINCLDEPPENDKLKPSQVLVGFGSLHRQAINAGDVQILIMPGCGNYHQSEVRRRERRCAIRRAVYDGLKELIDADPSTKLWPEFDIEVTLMDMSGYSVAPGGDIQASWGNPK